MNNSNVDLNELSNKIKDQTAERLTRELLAINRSFDNAKIATNTNMPVDVFSNYFVDYFLDVFQNDDDPNKKIDFNKINQYIQVAGGYFNEVNLIDNKGEVIDVLPSLYVKRDNIDQVAQQNDLDYKVDRYVAKTKAGYGSMAEAYITEEFDHIQPTDQEEEDRVKHKELWLEKLNKYKLNTNVTDMDKDTYNKTKQESTNDLVEYDYED